MVRLRIDKVQRPLVVRSFFPANTPARNAFNKPSMRANKFNKLIDTEITKLLFDNEISFMYATRRKINTCDLLNNFLDYEVASP